MIVALLFTNCTKEDENQFETDPAHTVVPDPAGTVVLNVINNARSYEMQGVGALCLTSDNNYYGWGGYGYTGINTIGEVAGLGNITKIPDGISWPSSVAAIPGYGYIINFHGHYVRFYVVDWIASGGTLIKYQAEWFPEQ